MTIQKIHLASRFFIRTVCGFPATQSCSLHPLDAVQGFGCSPTSILQSKNGLCIYEDTACGRYEASQCAPQIWKSFCNWDRPFSSSTWSGRLFFCSGNFCICNRSKQGKLVPTRNFLNQIFQIRLQKYLLGFAQTRYSAQNCADCASYPLKALWPTRGWYHPVLSLFAKVFIAFSCNPPKVAYFQVFLLTRLDFCGSLFQQFNITYLLRVPVRLPKESEQVFDFLIAT